MSQSNLPQKEPNSDKPSDLLPQGTEKSQTDVHSSSSDPVQSARITQELYQGPIPPAAELQRYEGIERGLASRIVGMAERAVDGQIKSHHMVISGSVSLQKMTIVAGSVIALTAMMLGYLLLREGKDGYGFGLIIGAIASLVGAFIWGKHIESKIEEVKAGSEAD